mgnify:CR=1 FL=1
MNIKYRFFFVGLIALLFSSCQLPKQTKIDIKYIVTPDFDRKSLDIEFSKKAPSNGKLKLLFENESMGETDLFNCLRNFKVTPIAKQIKFVKDSSYIEIEGLANQEYTINYSIVKDYKHPPINQKRYRPIIDSTYFHVLGTKLFMYPSDLFSDQSTKTPIQIQWNFKSENDLFHSSFGYGKMQSLNISLDELHNSFFVGGDFRRYTFDYKKKPIHFVTRGKWKFINDEDILRILKQTINNQHTFWNDTINKTFSVSLIPTYEENSYSVGGSSLTSSFISYASNNRGTTKDKMAWLYNHELMHKWIARTIQVKEDVVYYWFSEGFTDYYTYKLMLKNDILTLGDFIKKVNSRVLIPHLTDKVATKPNGELTFQKYWSNYDLYGKLPYRRGFLYAFLLDHQIKRKTNFSKSLDDVMFRFHKKAKMDKNFRIDDTIFTNVLSLYLDQESVNKDFEKYIQLGEIINFEKHLFKGMYIKKTHEAYIFEVNPAQKTKLLHKLKI